MSAIPCYYINLERSKDRAIGFEAECHRLGITATRFPAVEGSQLPQQVQERLMRLPRHKEMLSLAEIGCYLSHRNLWTHVVEKELAWTFIAEDDISFADNARLFFKDFDWLPPEADIVKAETWKQRIWMSPDIRTHAHGHKIHQLLSRHYGAAGYFLSFSGAKRLLALTENQCDPVDCILFDERFGIRQQLLVFQIDKALCIQDDRKKKARSNAYVSTLEEARKHGNKAAKLKQKDRPKGLAIVWRELTRPFKRGKNRLKIFWATISGKAIIKKIKIDGF